MKTKLEMAHEYAMAQMVKDELHTDLAKRAWDYADAMQAEADKREKEEAEQRRKEVREILNAPNTFVEREGQHFDDIADACKTYGSSDEWQPDWSQAPDWANWWVMDENRDCYWHSCVDSPFIGNGVFDVGDSKGHTYDSPSFGYTGNWRESLRKRPK